MIGVTKDSYCPPYDVLRDSCVRLMEYVSSQCASSLPEYSKLAGYVRADAGDRLLAYEGLRLSFTFVIRRVMRCGFVVIGGVSEVR